MVARIKVSSALNRAFYYNENKVKEGVAECLMAQNYPFELDRMTEVQRLNVLHKATSLRESLKANTVHISLNFDPSETISKEKIKEIAADYMQQIGFGRQSYLVYQHYDAGHPHIHIVTTKIDLKGKAINTNNIGKNQSETARKSIEIKYGLVKAEGIKEDPYTLKSAYVQRANYGKSETRKAIATVLDEVIKKYKFSSIYELNAVLKLYNVRADEGAENSRTFLNKGLHYKILDDAGLPVGVPIKASLFHQKPTLKFLEERFKVNAAARLPQKVRIKNAIDIFFLNRDHASIQALQHDLEKAGIDTVIRQNTQGVLYGITFVDHQTKCVFNGSDLGKSYSAKAIQEKCGITAKETKQQTKDVALKQRKSQSPKINDGLDPQAKQSPTRLSEPNSESILDTLLQVEKTGNAIPYELSAKKKRRKKRKSL